MLGGLHWNSAWRLSTSLQLAVAFGEESIPDIIDVLRADGGEFLKDILVFWSEGADRHIAAVQNALGAGSSKEQDSPEPASYIVFIPEPTGDVSSPNTLVPHRRENFGYDLVRAIFAGDVADEIR